MIIIINIIWCTLIHSFLIGKVDAALTPPYPVLKGQPYKIEKLLSTGGDGGPVWLLEIEPKNRRRTTQQWVVKRHKLEPEQNVEKTLKSDMDLNTLLKRVGMTRQEVHPSDDKKLLFKTYISGPTLQELVYDPRTPLWVPQKPKKTNDPFSFLKRSIQKVGRWLKRKTTKKAATPSHPQITPPPRVPEALITENLAELIGRLIRNKMAIGDLSNFTNLIWDEAHSRLEIIDGFVSETTDHFYFRELHDDSYDSFARLYLRQFLTLIRMIAEAGQLDDFIRLVQRHAGGADIRRTLLEIDPYLQVILGPSLKEGIMGNPAACPLYVMPMM